MTKNDCYLGFVSDLKPGEVSRSLKGTTLKDFQKVCDAKMVTWFTLTKNSGLLLPYEEFTPSKELQSKDLIFKRIYRQLSQFRKCFLFTAEKDAWCFDLIKYLRRRGIWIAQIRDVQKIINASKNVVITKTEYFALLKALERKVTAFKPEVIVGLKQGGTLPASYCAQHLRCQKLNLVTKRYNGRRAVDLKIEGLEKMDVIEGRKVAVIDDLVDEGKTLAVALARLKERRPSALKPFVLLCKDGAEIEVEHVRKVPRRWVTFWYDA